MITGLYRTPNERVENIIINTTLISQIGMILLKVANISTLSWVWTMAPLAGLVALIVLVAIVAFANAKFMDIREAIHFARIKRLNEQSK